MSAALEVESLTVVLGGHAILSGVDLLVPERSTLAITGRSGAGKTTLLSTILGIMRPTSGRVVVRGRDLSKLHSSALARLRRRDIGMVFQHGELMPELDPVENVAVAALLDGCAPRDAWERAQALLSEMAVPANRTRTDELSGGERQRVALARALVNRPGLVLADEPTGALDPETRRSIEDLLFSVPERWGASVVLVTHDQALAARAADTIELSGDHDRDSVRAGQ